jgi:hypothetical protein
LDGDCTEDTFAEDTFEPNQSIQSGDVDDNTHNSLPIQGTENVLPSNQNESAGNQSVPSPRSFTAQRSAIHSFIPLECAECGDSLGFSGVISNKKRRVEAYNHLRSQLIQNPPTISHSTCEHDECEMFFLSLAKTIKKLAPAEQVKVKMGVSKIVFLAELNSTKNITQFNNNCQYQHLLSPSTIDSSGSFSSPANTPTPNASPAPQQE